MKRLPPLPAIEAFIHAARTGSVKAAAEALALSPPALSRRIQTLERHLGRQLFERRHRGLRLTGNGARLHADLAPALDGLSRAVERAAGHEERLRLAVLPLFASTQIVPRLAGLRAAHPRLHIDIDTASLPLARLDNGIDAAITLSQEVDRDLYARRLGTSRIVAIGSRKLAQGPEKVARAADLAGANILLHRDLPDAFDRWRVAAGLPRLEPAAVDHFDSGQLMLDAAAAGLGVAFMFELHLESSPDPRLCKLFEISAESPYHYWFVCRRPALTRSPVRKFHDWLVAELGLEGPPAAAA